VALQESIATNPLIKYGEGAVTHRGISTISALTFWRSMNKRRWCESVFTSIFTRCHHKLSVAWVHGCMSPRRSWKLAFVSDLGTSPPDPHRGSPAGGLPSPRLLFVPVANSWLRPCTPLPVVVESFNSKVYLSPQFSSKWR